MTLQIKFNRGWPLQKGQQANMTDSMMIVREEMRIEWQGAVEVGEGWGKEGLRVCPHSRKRQSQPRMGLSYANAVSMCLSCYRGIALS